jgi:hypothetical protein
MLEVIDLRRVVLSSVSFRIYMGTAVAVRGHSGAGKTLLLRAIADLDPNEGQVRLEGRDRESFSAPEWRRQVGYLPAEPGWWADTVGEHFTDRAAAAPLLQELRLAADIMGWPVARLSTGERARYRTVAWREGSAGTLRSRFAALRVRPAHRDILRATPRAEEWLLIEWPAGEKEPSKYFLSTLPATAKLKQLVDLAKLRWRIERDYQDLKQELDLGHYEGRGWRGFHHHATLSIAAYGFLLSERSPIPPSAARWLNKLPRPPKGFRPRGSPEPTGAPCSELHRDQALANRRPAVRHSQAMSVLPATNRCFMTQ